jgi:hypothetical protein
MLPVHTASPFIWSFQGVFPSRVEFMSIKETQSIFNFNCEGKGIIVIIAYPFLQWSLLAKNGCMFTFPYPNINRYYYSQMHNKYSKLRGMELFMENRILKIALTSCWHPKLSREYNGHYHQVSVIKVAREHARIITFGAWARKTTFRVLNQPESA